jgi:hypothetical protein
MGWLYQNDPVDDPLTYFRRRTPIFEALDRPGFHCRLKAATLAAATIAVP